MQQQDGNNEQDKKGSKLVKDETFKTDHRTPTPTPPADDPSQNQAAKWVDSQKSEGQQTPQPGQRPAQQAGEDRSKSFGESSNLSGGNSEEQDDADMIPKENSFPQYKQAGNPKEKSQDYTN